MDEDEVELRKQEEDPSIPADYVSLAQLQHQWLQRNQQPKKLQRNQEEERRGKPTQGIKNRNNQNQLSGFQNEENPHVKKMAGGFRKRPGKETGVIEDDKGKGKEEIVVDGFENGFESQSQDQLLGFQKNEEGHVKMAGGYRRERLGRREGNDAGKEMGVLGDKGSLRHRSTFPFETGSSIEDKGKEIAIVGFEDGVENQRKKNRKKKKKKGYFGKGESAGAGEKWNGVDEVNPSSEIKEFDGGSEAKMEVLSGNDGAIGKTESVYVVEVSNVETMEAKGGSRSRYYKSKKEYGGRYNRLKETEEKLDLERKMEDGKGRVKWRELRNSEYKEKCDGLKESRCNVLKGKNVEMESEKKDGDEILEACGEMAGSKGIVKRGLWGKRINGRKKTKERRVEENGLKDNAVTVEKKVDKEVLGVESVKNGENGEIKNGYRRHDVNKTKERVEGNGLNDNRVIVEKKVDDEGLAVESVKNGEKEEIGDGYRRSDGNMRGNICRKFEGSTFNERREGNMRTRAETGFGDRRISRSYARFGGFERQCKMKQIESGMMWVKKDKSGTDGAGR